MKLTKWLLLFCVGVLLQGCSAKTDRQEVQLTKCVDGDTAHFSEIGKTRFLYIDTPESTKTVEPYGKEAAEYGCKLLTEAKKIEIEYDGEQKDKYDRTLAWIFVDGQLYQKLMAEQGYVKKFYDYGDYKYEDEIQTAQEDAKERKVGMWK